MNFLTALRAAEETAAQISFQPLNFIENLKYMGIGMLVIFAVIGVIVLTTVLINKVFAD
jgi:hypothetical protein